MHRNRYFLITWALISLLSAASCGFTPVYAPGTGTQQALSEIEIAEPKSKQSYLFVREMEDRIGRSTNPSKLLKYEVKIRGEGVESDSDRRRFVGVVTYRLIENETKKLVASGSVDSFAGYSVSDGLLISAREDAVDRLIVILADQVTRELIAKLAQP